MSRQRIRVPVSLGTALGTALFAGSTLVASPGYAHNAGHFYLPSGQCHNVGSFKDAPLVGKGRTQLDLVPETPMDEYGTSFVGYQGKAHIAPGGCPR